MQKKILVVEAGGQLQDMLKEEYCILEATNSEEILCLAARDVSAVLLSMDFPGVDGLAVLRKIRAATEFSALPVIMITNSHDQKDRVAALSLGANEVITRPYGAPLVKHCLRNCIAFFDTDSEAAKLKAIMDNISGGVVITVLRDDMPEILLANDRFYGMLGYTKAEYKKAFTQVIGPFYKADAPGILEAIRTVTATGRQIMADFRAQHKNGSLIWIRNRITRLTLNSHGNPLQLSVLYDITEQKAAEERLRQTEQELRIALRHSGTTICQFDILNRTLCIPPEVAEARGLPQKIEDMPNGLLRLQLIHPDSEASYKVYVAELLWGRPRGSAMFQVKLLAGWRWLEAHYTTIFSDTGKPVRAIISYLDVTERLEKEAIYKRWQESMEGRASGSYSLFRFDLNKNTTYDMESGELLHGAFDLDQMPFNARAQAYVSRCVISEDRERYLSLVNSDALLTAYQRGNRSFVLEYRERLQDGLRWLRLTIELARNVNTKDVEAYLLYENIDSEKKESLLTLQEAELDPLTGLLNRAAFETELNRLTGEKTARRISALFLIDLDGFKKVNDSFGRAIGDQTLIQMAQKLCANFREKDLICRLNGDKFMVYMQNVLHIAAVTEKASLICALLHKSFSLEVQLSASIGISIFPSDGQSFDLLYRKADLALYHVKQTGKDNFSLYAENLGDTPAAEPNPASVAASAHSDCAVPKHRMLIVEDNLLNREYLAGLFEDNFIIETAAEGTAAIVKLRRYGPGISVVLLDLRMPGIDGFAVLKAMRESPTMQTIPVIVVSGMDERENCLKAIREGATDYITKPVDPELLRLRVAAALGKAENDRLRAQNRFLAIQNQEEKRLAEARQHSEALAVALHAAERADIAKTQFLSSMSHEIRTPLNAVIGYISIAETAISAAKSESETRQASMKVLDCLTKCEIASKQLLTIINDVLDMSAIEAGKLKVDNSPFDFRSLITSLTVLFFAQAKAKGIRFEVRFRKPTDEWFRGDQLRVNQILTNLLSNAVKFTPEGGNVTLTITETSNTPEAVGFRFVVEDTGIGMTQEYLAHIWTPFEQAEASISRRFGGSGLGLSITKNLVDLMGGIIDVTSTSGVGSKFTVDLSFRCTEQPAKTANYDFSNINALVVDDDSSTCDYIKLLFDRCGARCKAVTSGAAAVEAFSDAQARGTSYNMCLIDWRMPHMDGFETISEIRKRAAAQLPVVVVTAYDFSEVAEQAQALGINRFISKPLFQSSLFDLLATVSRAPKQMAPQNAPKYDFDGVRVLLAEDNNMNMEVAKHILMSARLEVDCAWNGQEAFDIFTASRPGTYLAILMDVHMPEVDGYLATRMIRASKHPDARLVPIVAMTADVFAEDIADAHNAGMNAHVAKPIDVDALMELLSSYREGKE